MKYSEIELSSETLDQTPVSEEPKTLIIATSPRSGSFMLCRLMINAGLGVPHEYFNPIHTKILAKRLEVQPLPEVPTAKDISDYQSEYIQKLRKFRTKSGIFASKIQFWQKRDYLTNPAGDALFQGARFIYLYREELLKQAISLHTSRVTGRWGFNDDITTKPQDPSRLFDIKSVLRAMDDIAAEDVGWRLFFAQHGIKPLVVKYEDLCANQGITVGLIAKFIEYNGNIPLSYVDQHSNLEGEEVSRAREFLYNEIVSSSWSR